MTHRNVVATLERLGPSARRRVAEFAPLFC
jgi:hypothetical protein